VSNKTNLTAVVRADADAGTQPTTEIPDAMRASMDAVAKTCLDAVERCMDAVEGMGKRMDARMDALAADRRRDAEGESEEDKKKREEAEREDARRRDAAEGESEEDKKKREDKARRDAEEERERADAARRRDAEGETEEDKKKREEAEREDARRRDAAVADSASLTTIGRSVAELAEKLGVIGSTVNDLVRVTPRPLDDAAADALVSAQARADGVYHLFGERAPPPQVNEGLVAYRRRLLRPLQVHSETWKEADLLKIADAAAFDRIEGQVYADAEHRGVAADSVPAGKLRPVTRRSDSGHQITEYVGDTSAWMAKMAGAISSRVTGSFTE
jgi:hypothetical protein